MSGPLAPIPLVRPRPDPGADRIERRLRDERAGDRLVARGAAEGDGQVGLGGARRSRSQLAADPGRFLSTVQIGITLIGILAGAYSGASLGGPVGRAADRFARGRAETAQTIGFTLVIVITTYPVAGHRRTGAQAIRAAQPRDDRGDRVAADGAGCRKVDRAVRVAARPDQRRHLPDARPRPREQECRDRRGAPPGRRRGADRRRARGE